MSTSSALPDESVACAHMIICKCISNANILCRCLQGHTVFEQTIRCIIKRYFSSTCTVATQQIASMNTINCTVCEKQLLNGLGNS